MSLKLGIIGYGKMASGWHAKIPTQLPEVDLVAVHDIDPERVAAARADGYRAYDSLGDFLKDEEVNFVLVATPNDFHKPLAIAVMEAGKNVMVEKPATLSARDWEEMMAVSSRTGRVLTVHHNRRWDLDYQTAKKIISEGFIGKPHAISSTYQLWMPGRKLSGLRWRDIPEHGGGLFYDWGVHLCDQLLNLYPEDPIVSVYMRPIGCRVGGCMATWAWRRLRISAASLGRSPRSTTAQPKKTTQMACLSRRRCL